jgi:hypothetical protein
MALPSLPWYGAIERGLEPVSGHLSTVLILIAVACVITAWKGDNVIKMAVIVYLVSP